MKFLTSGSKLLYRLLIVFTAIFVMGLVSISTMNDSGNQVAHNIEVLAEQQLPKLDTIHSLQTLIKKLELALYRYYETTDADTFAASQKTCRLQINELLNQLDNSFVSRFKQNFSAFETVISQFDAEMSKPGTDWNLLRIYLEQSRKISLDFETLVDNKQNEINASLVDYHKATDNVVSAMISTQIKFSIFTFLIILIIAFLLIRQLKQHRIQQELAHYPQQNPYPILRFNNSGEALYINPAAEKLAKSLGMENDLIKLIPKECFTVSQTRGNTNQEIKEFQLGKRLFTAHIHHIDNSQTFYAYLIDTTEQLQAEHELVRQSTHDVLTGLPNRRLLEVNLLQKTSSTMKSFGLMLLKINRLELINSSLGHQMSDRICIQVSEALNSKINDYDEDGIRLYAFEPGSWVITFESQQLSFTESHKLANHFLALFTSPISVKGHNFKMSGHIGITQYPLHGTTPKELLRNADAAMRTGVKEGKFAQFYNKAFSRQATEWLQLEQGMEQAIKKEEFSLNIQPKVYATNSALHSGEVLIRWHKEGEWISPAQFIPIAEESGLIIAIGEWVLTTACQQWVSWSKQGLKPQPLAINISAQQFIQSEFIELVMTVLQATGMPPTALELEITEEVAGQNPEKIIETMRKLKQIGVQLAIDDFGTGYSSLSYLTLYPVDTLKIDRAFVSKMDTDENNYAIVRMVMSLAKELNLKVVAEGVETEQQKQMLVELGCDLIQGYYFYRPLTINDYQSLITDKS